MTIESDGTLDDIIQASNRVKLLNNMSIIQERGHDNAMISTKELFDSLPEKAYPNLPNRRYQVGVPVTGKYEVAKFKNITFEHLTFKNITCKKPTFQTPHFRTPKFQTPNFLTPNSKTKNNFQGLNFHKSNFQTSNFQIQNF